MADNKSIWTLDSDRGALSVYREVLEPAYTLAYFNSLADFQKYRKEMPGEKPQLMITESQLDDGNPLQHLTDTIPFLIVSSNESETAIRRSFEAGALDYLLKPIHQAELTVKVDRLMGQMSNSYLFAKEGEIWFSSKEFCLKKSERLRSELTRKEFQLFSILNNAKGMWVTRLEIQKLIWDGARISNKAFDVHLFNLRKKLEKLGVEIRFSQPEGYSLVMSKEKGS